jgi:hypothetical protein
MLDHRFYEPSDQGYEALIAERLQRWRQAQSEYLKQQSEPPKKENHANHPADPSRGK